MGTGLVLKKKIRGNIPVTNKEITDLLSQSKLVKTILGASYRTDTFTGLRKLEFLLLELSEIPYTERLPQAQKMLTNLIYFTKQARGFSLSKDEEGILTCHQGMITMIMIRFDQKELAAHGVDWILNYHIFERDEFCIWPGSDFFNRFGCSGHTPCYDGLVKSMRALAAFKNKYGNFSELQKN